MDQKDIYEELVGVFTQEKVDLNKVISPYTTLRTQTVAEYFIKADRREDIISAVQFTKKHNLDLLMVGGGSNMAILHDNIKGLVVRNMYSRKEIIEESTDSVEILFSSGYIVSRVVRDTTEAGYEGFEYHMGLPGTVGGSLYMNSKWTHPLSYFGDNLVYANVIDRNGEIHKRERDYFEFAYDYSILQKTKEIVLEAVFKLKKNDPEELKERAKAAQEYRKVTQPFGVATAGCFFRNITHEEQHETKTQTRSAGALIDSVGLKGTQIGDFIISEKHANFIINKGQGKPEDLVTLLKLIKGKVKAKYGIELQEEVVLI